MLPSFSRRRKKWVLFNVFKLLTCIFFFNQSFCSAYTYTHTSTVPPKSSSINHNKKFQVSSIFSWNLFANSCRNLKFMRSIIGSSKKTFLFEQHLHVCVNIVHSVQPKKWMDLICIFDWENGEEKRNRRSKIFLQKESKMKTKRPESLKILHGKSGHSFWVRLQTFTSSPEQNHLSPLPKI